jgi:hypothetical protein
MVRTMLRCLVLLLACAAAAPAQQTTNREIYTSEIREAVSGVGTLFPNGIANTYQAGAGPSGWTVSERVGVHRTVVTLDYDMTITDAGVAGAHGSVKVYDFPEGRIYILTSHADFNVTCDAVASGLSATATYELGVGTAAAGVDDAALATTEEDIIAGALGDLTDSAVSYEAVLSTGAAHDGSATAKDAYVNLVFAADDSGAEGGTCNIAGPLSITWFYVGDD